MTTNSKPGLVPPRTTPSDDVHSDAYFEALSRIEFELCVRSPEYRNINHHNWELFLGNPSQKERLRYIDNVVICFVLRACAIFDHHICGSLDPDSSPPTPPTSQQIDLTVGGCLVDTLHRLLSHRPAFKAKITLMEYEDQSELINNFIELADCLISSEQE